MVKINLVTLMVAWFVTNIILSFLTFGAWIIPGINFVAGPISLLVVMGVNLIFFLIAFITFMKRYEKFSNKDTEENSKHLKALALGIATTFIFLCNKAK